MMKAAFESLSLKWLAARMPPAPTHRLSHGNIFIFPGVFGLFYLLMTLCLFLLAINYQNNLLLFLCQFLLSLILIALFTAYKNVAGMQITAVEIEPVFAGENGYLELRVEDSDEKPLHGQIEIKWYGDKNRLMLDLETDKRLSTTQSQWSTGRKASNEVLSNLCDKIQQVGNLINSRIRKIFSLACLVKQASDDEVEFLPKK